MQPQVRRRIWLHRRAQAYLWSGGSSDLRDSFHPMIVLAILLSVLEGLDASVDLSFDDLDLNGLKACAVLAGLTDAVGQHEFTKIEGAAALTDIPALRRLAPEQTRTSILADVDSLQQLMSRGDGEGFGFFLPEQMSGVAINSQRRREGGRWFDTQGYHELV